MSLKRPFTFQLPYFSPRPYIMKSNTLLSRPAAVLRSLGFIGLSLVVSFTLWGNASAQEAGASAAGAATTATALETSTTPVFGQVANEPLNSPYGLASLWSQGDWVARGTLLLLLIMSVVSWYILFSRLATQSKSASYAREAQKIFSGSMPVRQGISRLSATSPFRFVSHSALESESRFASLNGQVDLSTWLSQNIENAVGTIHARQQSGLAELATIGSTAPFVGLFGTVWGIYNALVKIGATGQASLDKVAGPVGEALIMTALGLAVAVPAVLAYNWLVRRNRQNMELVKNYASGLHTELLANPPKRASH
jgi:biopolymer transport protein ExbB